MALTADREIVLSRRYDAPRELVWRAWTETEHIAKWWGPNGFTNTVYEMEVRPGGRWRFVMHGPDGTDWDNRIVYEEVVWPERLVYQHGKDLDEDPDRFHVTVTFEAIDDQTVVTMRTLFPTVEACEAVKKFGAVELGRETLACLADYLPTMVE